MKKNYLFNKIIIPLSLAFVLTGCGASGASIYMNNGEIVNIGDATPQIPEEGTEEETEESAEETPAEGEQTPDEGSAEGATGETGSDPYITGGDISPFYKPDGDYAVTDPAAVPETATEAPVTDQPAEDTADSGRGDTSGLGSTMAEVIDNTADAVNNIFERKEADLYVATYGNDESGDGSYDNPYLTIQKALDTVTAGHTIYILSGVYSGANTFSASGSGSGPITVTSYPGSSVTVQLGAGEMGAIFDINGNSNISINNLTIGYSYAQWVYGVFMHDSESNINISQCEFTNMSTTSSPGSGGAYAILAYGTGAADTDAISDVTIYNNKVHNIYTGYSEAVAASGNVRNINIEGNTIYEISNIGIDIFGGAGYCRNEEFDQPRDCIITGNTVYQCVSPFTAVAGIYVSGARNCVIRDNYVYENAYGIEVADENYNYHYPTTAISVERNTIHNNHDSGLSIGGTNAVTSGYVTNSSIVGNILYNNGAYVNDGANGEIHFEKCDTISVMDNIVRNHDYANAVIGCSKTSEYVKNVSFNNNLYAYDKPEKIVFKFQGNDYIGLDNWNKFTGGKDISSVKASK